MAKRTQYTLAVALAVVVPSALFLPLASYHWTLYPVTPFNQATGANPVFVSAPIAEITDKLNEYTWHLFPTLPETLYEALSGIAMFVVAIRLLGLQPHRETVCRKCRCILRGLDHPECPRCGEAL